VCAASRQFDAMTDNTHKTARLIAVAACTVISLACGTNYAYSAWGPQFADRLRLSSTESNIIGTMGNLGMYASGVPVGILVDGRGPRPSVLLGGACLALGYFPLKMAYDGGEGSMNIALLAFFSFLTGLGSCAAFSASIKTGRCCLRSCHWAELREIFSCFELASTPRNGNWLATFSVWLECPVLHHYIRFCSPRQHLWTPSTVINRN
jgi:hypothetical protein